MERKVLASSAADYPYLQGLWLVMFGFMIAAIGVSNLHRVAAAPWGLGVVVGCLLVCTVARIHIARYYRDNFGQVTPTRSRQVRYAVAVVAGVAVLFGGSRLLFWSADSPLCIFATACALGTLAYYAILVGLRAYHVVIWGSLAVAGLLPIWGGLGQDRDAVAMFPLGVAFIVSGLFDQRRLVRSLGSAKSLNLENSNAGE